MQCCRSSTCFYLTYIQYCVQQFTHCAQCGTVLSLNAAISHYLLSFFHSINFEFLMTWVHFYHKRNSGGGGNIPYILLRDGPFYFSFFFLGGGAGELGNFFNMNFFPSCGCALIFFRDCSKFFFSFGSLRK